jgi:signal transduction histidine kinase
MVEEEERQAAAALIAADPAFAALEASGVPIVAVVGEPARIVYRNEAALAALDPHVGASGLLGEDGGASRLEILIQSARRSAAPRLERAPIQLREGSRTVTVLCRRIEQSATDSLFVIAALGLGSEAAVSTPAQMAAESEMRVEPPAGGAKDVREALAARCGQSAPRFLWKTDAEGVFIEASPILSEVAGPEYAALCGRSVEEVARALGLGPVFEEALRTRRSWSGVRVDWPIEKPRCRAPTFLGAMPIFDKARRFLGFQGFGVLRLDQAEACGSPSAAGLAPEAAAPAAAPEESEPATDNVVALHPSSAVNREPPDRLTEAERDAFEEIGRALGETPAAPTPRSARELIDQVAKALEQARAPPNSREEGPRYEAKLLDLLPFGVIVARGAEALYANRTLLDELGYPDLPALAGDGGLARIFTGRSPPHGQPSGAVELRAQDGQSIDVEAHLQTIDWEGAPATLISLRRQNSRRGTEDARLRAKDAEIAGLGAQMALLDASFEHSPAPAALIAKDGRIERANSAFAKLLGKTPGETGGQELATLLGEEEYGRTRARIIGLSLGEAAEGAALIDLVRLRDPTGTPWRLTARPVDPTRILCVAISEAAREIMGEAQEARAEAERASEAKTAFLARISHEIRTPISAIMGFAEVMMEERFGPLGSQRYKEYLKDVHSSGAHVLSLVNDLLDLSKIEAGKMELVVERLDVNAVIEECVSIMQNEANRERVIIRLSLAPRSPRIAADERSLRQILLNLLSNAIKFNEPGGQVIVSSAPTDDGHVLVRVKDTGIGMSNDEIALALEPFRQVRSARPSLGTGLGLPVTKALIEANRASFAIWSRKTEGTLVEIAFPAAASAAAAE